MGMSALSALPTTSHHNVSTAHNVNVPNVNDALFVVSPTVTLVYVATSYIVDIVISCHQITFTHFGVVGKS